MSAIDGAAVSRSALSSLRKNPHFLVGILFVVAVINLIDRKIIFILQDAIKSDLGLSDTQLGALTGFAFAAVYSCVCFPIAHYADRGVRKAILAWALGLWSLLTALSGFATNFIALGLCRMGVAIGESVGTPASHSMIADAYPPCQRQLAYAIWSQAIPVGTVLGYLAGGWLT